MENIKVNPIKSEVSSEQKMQAPELADDQLLNDEELEAVCGGFLDNIDLGGLAEVVRAGGEVLGKVYKAGEDVGKAVSGRAWNDDRYC